MSTCRYGVVLLSFVGARVAGPVPLTDMDPTAETWGWW